MRNRRRRARSLPGCAALIVAFACLACEPKVGSDAWCEKMKETPSGDWSTNDATSFAKHCVFK